jgi:hypothetical protein
MRRLKPISLPAAGAAPAAPACAPGWVWPPIIFCTWLMMGSMNFCWMRMVSRDSAIDERAR